MAGDGNMPQVVRDVLQLFSSRGGRLTVFSQRSPRAVRAVLGGLRLLRLRSPAAVRWPTGSRRGSGQPLCSFAGCEESIFKKLPAAVGLGIALQMADGSTRVLRMSTALERHLRRGVHPFTLCSPADVKGEDVLRILLYQDRQQLPIQALLERRWGTMPPCCARAHRHGCHGADTGCRLGGSDAGRGLPARQLHG